MKPHWCYFFFLLWFCYLIVSSILLFTKGFLLTRETLKHHSSCVPFQNIPCPEGNNTKSQCDGNRLLKSVLANKNEPTVCLPLKTRVVLLIIDALRYDFTTFDPENRNPKPYQNKLPIINNLAINYPDRTRLFKFIADPPTTTMQRLKGLTTGNLPTFIDAGSNFASPEIDEDNIIDQLKMGNKNIVFMGDDTWVSLYPGRFKRQYPYPSFNVFDLDTVDNGVLSKIYNEINEDDWSLMVAHFLGVDHCGHRYGPDHFEMARKLSEMNDVIRNITEKMDENAVLIVIGDHGMTSSGDHGGDTQNEITSALFLHSKQPLHRTTGKDEVKQVDLVPTLSAILGIPVAYSNLGILITDCLISLNSTKIPDWELALYSLWNNAKQIMTYVEKYSEKNELFKREVLDDFKKRFSVLNAEVLQIGSQEQFEDFARTLEKFLLNLRSQIEDVWVEFDSFAMTRGLLLLFMSMFLVYLVIDGIPNNHIHEIISGSFLVCSYGVVIISSIVVLLLYYYNYVDNLLYTIFFYSGTISQLVLGVLVIQNWEVISLNWYSRSRNTKIINTFVRLVGVFTLASFLSNSYINEESSILLYILNSIIFASIITVVKRKNDLFSKIVLLGLLVMFLVRMTTYFWRCREEQSWCFAVFHSTKRLTSKLEWAVIVIFLALFVTFTKAWLRNCGNLNGYSINVLLAKYIPTVLVVCNGGYWVLNRLPVETKNKLVRQWQANLLAWIVYFLSSFSICLTILSPLLTFLLAPANTISVDNRDNLIPQLFRQIKGLFNSKKEGGKEDIPVVCGLATVYSAGFLTVAVYLVLVVALLLGDALAPSIVIAFLTASFLLVTISLKRIEGAETVEQLLDIPNVSILIWVVLSHYFFYGSGHQPTFSNIIWESAFVGISGPFANNYLQATLVIINTFCSQILMAFLLPLIIISPFTISVMLPTLVPKKSFLLQEDNSRGEVLLYERSTLMLSATFTTCCKFIMFNGLRVFASMLAATIHCRHLMAWKIFAPKFIFESISMFIILITINFAYLFLIRINNKVDNLIKTLTKKYS